MKKATDYRLLSVIQAGFEPTTSGLEGRCSIQLSYWTNIHLYGLALQR